MKLLRPINLKSHSGATLIEVLVAMVVFLVGILAVVHLFPSGFASVMRTGNTTIATSLAQMELDRWKSRVENLPAAILPIDPDGKVLTDLDPEDMSQLKDASNLYSDVNKRRRVYGESTRIPVPYDTTWSTGKPGEMSSVYLLGFCPVMYNEKHPVTVYSNALRRVSMPGNPEWARMRYSDYAIDLDAARIYVGKLAFDRDYVISYSYWSRNADNGQPELVSVVSQTINFTAGSNVDGNLQWADIPGPSGAAVKGESGFMAIEYDSDSLHRKFADLTGNFSGWSTVDPFQFVVKDTAAGVIAFNPLGYGYEMVTDRGRRPLVAYIDYDVYNWHILREQRTVPNQPNSDTDPYCSVRLTLNYIKMKDASYEADGSPYAGLPWDNNAPDTFLQPYDVLAIDMRTGEKYNEQSTIDVGGDKVSVMHVDYKTGVVGFHSSLANRTFLICYEADNDWAVQVFKGYESYRRHLNVLTGADQLGFREFYLELSNDDRGRLFFPRCYAGDSVAVDYTYRSNEPNSVLQRVSGEVYQISTDTGLYGHCYIDLLDKVSRSLKLSKDEVTIVDVSRVYGVSLGARVIWRDGGSGKIIGKWRSAVLQTYLTGIKE